MRAKGEASTLYILFLAFVWFFFNVGASVYIKDYLVFHPLPTLVTLAQAAVGTICGILTLGVKAIYWPKDKKSRQLILLNAFSHCYATLLTNASTFYVAVSFTHTVKASDPLFTAIVSRYVLQARENMLTYFSILVTVVGITLASLTEFNFDTMGLIYALVSTFLFSVRTVYSKKTMVDLRMKDSDLFLVISLLTMIFSGISAIFMGLFYPEEYYNALFGYVYQNTLIELPTPSTRNMIFISTLL
eukprot:TRINITY_DN1164_c0_g1_i2.p1 TRINITY_DN1164_c0_g1~~TRINITY_DN1164_c0_g1_i2.p1  ORF type:complete len:245 (+),score=16.03 TRINITY_DN1164_c0_g1_i2:75-809(+)